MSRISEIPQLLGSAINKVIYETKTEVHGGVMTKTGFVSHSHVPGPLLAMIENHPGNRNTTVEFTKKRVRFLGEWHTCGEPKEINILD